MKKRFRPIVLAFMLIIIASAPATAVPPETVDMEKAVVQMELYIERHAIPEVKAVFDFFVRLVNAPLTPLGCKDGSYSAESVYDDFHYKHVISLEIQNGKIIAVQYDEVKEDGKGKKGNAAYCEQMKKGSGASPAEVYPYYEKQLLEKQDLGKIDAVTGATYSLYRFNMTAARALWKARGKS